MSQLYLLLTRAKLSTIFWLNSVSLVGARLHQARTLMVSLKSKAVWFAGSNPASSPLDVESSELLMLLPVTEPETGEFCCLQPQSNRDNAQNKADIPARYFFMHILLSG